MKKFLTFIFLILIIAGVYVVYHYAEKPSAEPAAKNVALVTVAKVQKMNIPRVVRAIGSLTASQAIQVSPQIAGQIEKIYFRDGSVVSEGTPLMQLDDTVDKAQLHSAEADLALSEMNFKRINRLAKTGATSEQELDKALADLKDKRAEVKVKQAMLDKMLLSAPFSGVLGASAVSAGEYVQVGQSLVSLTDIANLKVEYNVPENDLAQLKIGQTVTLTSSAFPQQKFTGTVSFVSATVNPVERTVSVHAKVANPNNVLSPGMFVQVTQKLGTIENALVIPTISLYTTIDGEKVYKVNDGKVTSVKVKVGERMNDTVQILKGVAVGETLVTTGQQNLKDGMEITTTS